MNISRLTNRTVNEHQSAYEQNGDLMGFLDVHEMLLLYTFL